MSEKKKFIPEVDQEVECFCCDSKRETPWLYPFSGYVKEVYDKSAMITIKINQPEDDGLVVEYHGKTIVPFTEMRAVKC
ncbi:hypothetical protein NXK88_000419 [Enterococcus hirae]|uniref:hypothetical protein n=1 Tax=Enterococcus hirae TaxID=1354 RepID=UPI0020746545|nr:hypothetical protein [Enterococcus hirae]EMF0201266.1 hypothetical protein [Enterococcus hirae]